MKNTELRIPRLGESVRTVQLSRLLKQVGDLVEKDEIIAEVTTDKVDSEVPSAHAGRVVELRFQEGDEIKIGEVFAVLDTSVASEAPDLESVANTDIPESSVQVRPSELSAGKTLTGSPSSNFLSPLVRKMVQTEGLTDDDIARITGSGRGGRISKNDVLRYLKSKQISPTTSPKKSSAPAAMSSYSGGSDIIEMDKMRKIIVQRMKQSVQTSPHVTAFVEADVTDLVHWREKHKDAFLKQFKQKLTITPLLVKAVVKAIQDFPMINVSVDESETKIIRHHDINIGIATELPNGNLIVPVIKQATQYNLEGLAKQLNSLVDKARTNKLSPDDVRGGTFTISNVGTFGNVMGTPIINQPEVAILATGVIKKKPAILETPAGDVFAARQFMFLSLSFDHRVVDGSLGGVFLKRVADYLEQWDTKTKF